MFLERLGKLCNSVKYVLIMATQYLRKVKQKVAAKFSVSRLILKSMSNNYLVIITPKSTYVLFQVMHEVYTEKIMTGTVFGY